MRHKWFHQWSQWPRRLRRGSAAASLLRSWVQIPPRAWMFVCCECCVLLGTGLCDEQITRPEESFRMWRVVVRDLETSRMRRLWPALGRSAKRRKIIATLILVETALSYILSVFSNVLLKLADGSLYHSVTEPPQNTSPTTINCNTQSNT